MRARAALARHERRSSACSSPPSTCARCSTFLLVTVARAGGGRRRLVGRVRRHRADCRSRSSAGCCAATSSHLDAELRARLEELRASRARLVEAGDAERRRLERDLHDGAQSRLVALALLLRPRAPARDRRRRAREPARPARSEELQTSLGELRELARGIHPAVLTERGLEPALHALAARAPVPVTRRGRRAASGCPAPVESAAYFVVSEALANVAKYAQATHAAVDVRRATGRVTVEVADDGVGGADAGARLRPARARRPRRGARRDAGLDSPAGRGTRLRARDPLRGLAQRREQRLLPLEREQQQVDHPERRGVRAERRAPGRVADDRGPASLHRPVDGLGHDARADAASAGRR